MMMKQVSMDWSTGGTIDTSLMQNEMAGQQSETLDRGVDQGKL